MLTDKLKNTLKKESKKYSGKESNRLEDAYIELLEKGLIKKPEYSLPLMDTIGKTYFNTNE